VANGRYDRLWAALKMATPLLALAGGGGIYMIVIAVQSAMHGRPGFVALALVAAGMCTYLVVKLLIGMRRYLQLTGDETAAITGHDQRRSRGREDRS
jgi:hypothetical protein